MRISYLLILIFLSFLGFASGASAKIPALKLPFEAGQSLPMTHGYWNGAQNDSHAFASDNYALDFGGCQYYGATIVAAATGTVSDVVRDKASLPTEAGRESTAYGNYVILDHGDGYFSRYAHLSEVNPGVQKGVVIIQGAPLGKMGDTGYAVSFNGTACVVNGVNHYGVHLHFALFQKSIKDGRTIVTGIKPEPMSGQTGFRVKTYISDNSLNGWAKAPLGNSADNRWIYWKINPTNPICSAGSNHVGEDKNQGTCFLVSVNDCPADTSFVAVNDAYGGYGTGSVISDNPSAQTDLKGHPKEYDNTGKTLDLFQKSPPS